MKNLGDRMKHNYENRSRHYLTRRTPVILRLDGQAFHTFTKKYCKKSFDTDFQRAMIHAAITVCKNLQGFKCAYVQSDEISILLTDYDNLNTEAWFDYNIQKVCSIAASHATLGFFKQFFTNNDFQTIKTAEVAFDCRSFNIPKEEVNNYFVWRQKDWLRNSIQMLAQAHFSHGELKNKNTAALHELLHGIGINWADLSDSWKNGTFIIRYEQTGIDIYSPCPIFAKNAEVIESLSN